MKLGSKICNKKTGEIAVLWKIVNDDYIWVEHSPEFDPQYKEMSRRRILTYSSDWEDMK